MRDEEAGVWVATSEDIAGLVTEAETYDLLIERVLSVAPELLRDNARFTRILTGEPIELQIETSHIIPPVAA
jgi:hypothetical protein